MPSKYRRDGLLAELSAVQNQIQAAESVGDVVGSMQFTYRETELNAALEALDLKGAVETSASVALLFGGGPVFGSRGIAADFSSSAIDKFQELVSKVFASTIQDNLGARGVVPGKSHSTFLISEVARGSFGFVLEESSPSEEDVGDKGLKYSLDSTLKMLEETSSQNEQDFQELLDSLDNRILQGLRAFFKVLDNADATMRAVDDAREVTLDSSAIDRARSRTESTKIEEKEIDLVVKLVGLLPEHRKFEAISDKSERIYGSIAESAVVRFNEYSASGKPVLDRTFNVKAIKRSITPLNLPTKMAYHLTDVISAQDGRS